MSLSSSDAACDPAIVSMVDTIRDRFGVSGLRAARHLIEQEIAQYAEVLAGLAEE
ncbi:MAG: hypothetical protein ACTHOD_17480 [Motilibacteraceae bacterium]